MTCNRHVLCVATLAVRLVLVGCLHFPIHIRAAAIRYCGSNGELSVSVVSDQTLQVSLAPWTLRQRGGQSMSRSS
jgi:hypothetical protein